MDLQSGADTDSAEELGIISDLWERLGPDACRELAHTKRFFECFHGDEKFRTVLAENPDGARALLDLAGCEVRLDDVRPVFDEEAARKAQTGEMSYPVLDRWHAYVTELLVFRERMRSSGDPGDTHSSFSEWRKRQIARGHSELGDSSRAIVHPIAAYELSSGCSVGCWFCGISAKKFGGHFPYDQETKALWRGVLTAMRSRFGPAAGMGFCYWATDPLDNPAYPQFLEDFNEINALMPQTTTAIPLRNLELTKTVLARSAEKAWVLNRFSVLSVNILRRLHRSFSAEELLSVELVLQNREAVTKQAAAGRAFERLRAAAEALPVEDAGPLRGSTIACVTGFLINMRERHVRLVSPTAASDQCPDGFIVFGEGHFETAEDFGTIIDALCAEHMTDWFAPTEPLAFRTDLKFKRADDGFELSNGRSVHRTDQFGVIADLIAEGTRSAAEVAQLGQSNGVPFFDVLQFLSVTRAHGLLQNDAVGLVDHQGGVRAK